MSRRIAPSDTVMLKWTIPFGPYRGLTASAWYDERDSEVNRLKREFGAVEVDRIHIFQ